MVIVVPLNEVPTKPRVGFVPPSLWNPSVFGIPNVTKDTELMGRFLRDNYGVWNLVIQLDKPALGGEQITWGIRGDATAIEDTHWSTTQTNTITLSQDDESVTIPITITNIGKWFQERSVVFQIIGGSGIHIHPSYSQVKLYIYPNAELPRISITSDGGTVDGNGTTKVITFTLDTESDSDTEIWYSLSGSLAATMVGPTQGSVIIPAGSLTNTITLTHDGTGSSGDECVVTADFERDTVKFVDTFYNPDTRQFDVNRNIYLDQNQWAWSNNLPSDIQRTKEDGLPLPFFPGEPTGLASGGIARTLPGQESDPGQHLKLHQQTDTPYLIDPITGQNLVWFGPNDQSSNGVPYLRRTFDSTLAGGSRGLHTARAWCRVQYYIEHPKGDDADSAAFFHRIGLRIRTQNRNHGIAIANNLDLLEAGNGNGPGVSGALVVGTDADGNTGATTFGPFSNGVTYWFWKQYECHPTDLEWGMFEDSNGIGIYFIHHVDDTINYPTGTNFFGEYDPKERVGIDEGNPIIYPMWYSSQDGSNVPTISLVRSRKMGTMAHSFSFQQSDTILTGPARFWPNLASNHQPRGFALKTPASEGSHTFSKL